MKKDLIIDTYVKCFQHLVSRVVSDCEEKRRKIIFIHRLVKETATFFVLAFYQAYQNGLRAFCPILRQTRQSEFTYEHHYIIVVIRHTSSVFRTRSKTLL